MFFLFFENNSLKEIITFIFTIDLFQFQKETFYPKTIFGITFTYIIYIISVVYIILMISNYDNYTIINQKFLPSNYESLKLNKIRFTYMYRGKDISDDVHFGLKFIKIRDQDRTPREIRDAELQQVIDSDNITRYFFDDKYNIYGTYELDEYHYYELSISTTNTNEDFYKGSLSLFINELNNVTVRIVFNGFSYNSYDVYMGTKTEIIVNNFIGNDEKRTEQYAENIRLYTESLRPDNITGKIFFRRSDQDFIIEVKKIKVFEFLGIMYSTICTFVLVIKVLFVLFGRYKINIDRTSFNNNKLGDLKKKFSKSNLNPKVVVVDLQ